MKQDKQPRPVKIVHKTAPNGVGYTITEDQEGKEGEKRVLGFIETARERMEFRGVPDYDLLIILTVFATQTGFKGALTISRDQVQKFMDYHKIESFEVVTEGAGEPPFRHIIERLSINIPIYGVKLIYKSKEPARVTVAQFCELYIRFIPEGTNRIFSNQTQITHHNNTPVPRDIHSSLIKTGGEIGDLLADRDRLEDAYRGGGAILKDGTQIEVRADSCEAFRSALEGLNKPLFIAFYYSLFKEALDGKRAGIFNVGESPFFAAVIDPVSILTRLGYKRPSNYLAIFDDFIKQFERIIISVSKPNKQHSRESISLLSVLRTTERNEVINKTGSEVTRRTRVIVLPLSDEQRKIATIIPDKALKLAKDAPERFKLFQGMLLTLIKKPDVWKCTYTIEELKELYPVEKTKDFNRLLKATLDYFQKEEIIKGYKPQGGTRVKGYEVTFPNNKLSDYRIYKKKEPGNDNSGNQSQRRHRKDHNGGKCGSGVNSKGRPRFTHRLRPSK